jgi:hypothetical protein
LPSLRAALQKSEQGIGRWEFLTRGRATAWVEVGAGERMVDHALIRIHQMLGHLTNTPQELDFKPAVVNKVE